RGAVGAADAPGRSLPHHDSEWRLLRGWTPRLHLHGGGAALGVAALWRRLRAAASPPRRAGDARGRGAAQHLLAVPSLDGAWRAALCCASPVALHDDRHPARGARQHGGPPAPRASTRRRLRPCPWHGAASGAVEGVVARRPLWAHKDTL
ncbi:Hypothetical protein EMIHUDRAFT_440665, partial [Emiliania huxleyi CCMP1516]|uniref:Uncharacterized protein n=2 Tax=Emiliania huxleyi TaxID=2903 RepID=A0A0D3KK47_EMIH1